MSKISIDSRGIVEESSGNGLVVSPAADNQGFAPFKKSATAKTASVSLTNSDAGVTTVSGTAALTVTLPSVSDAVGSIFAIRSLSAHAHILSSSASDFASSRVICAGTSGSAGASPISGKKITFPATVGSSVVLMSDGVQYHVLSSSGSVVVGT